MPDPVKVLICPLSTHERTGWWHPNLGKFVADLPLHEGYATRVVPLHNFHPAAAARNHICKIVSKELLNEVDWLCMIDNDMDPPFDLLDTIKGAPEDAGIVAPEFAMFSESERKLTLCWTPDISGYEGEPILLDKGFHRLSKCGSGVIFIRPKALLIIPYPYFEYTYDEDGAQLASEDVIFCQKAYKAGVKIYGNNAIRVGHHHSVDLQVMSQMLNSLDNRKATSVHFESKAECPSVEA